MLGRQGRAIRLQNHAVLKYLASVSDRDAVDAVALARMHRDELVLSQAQQRIAHRRAADIEVLRQILLAQLLARRQAAGQDVSPDGVVDIIAQQHL